MLLKISILLMLLSGEAQSVQVMYDASDKPYCVSFDRGEVSIHQITSSGTFAETYSLHTRRNRVELRGVGNTALCVKSETITLWSK